MGWRRTNLGLPVAVVILMTAVPLSVRASCDHPGGSFSVFIPPGGAGPSLSLPPLPGEGEAGAEASGHQPRTPNPVPCVRCGKGAKDAPSAPTVRLEREQALGEALILPRLAEPRWAGDFAHSCYSLERVWKIERPPRTA